MNDGRTRDGGSGGGHARATPGAEDVPLRVLLVMGREDEATAVQSLFASIRRPRVDIRWVSDYGQALLEVQRDGFDVQFFDLHMGGHSGLDLVRLTDLAGCHTPSIILAGANEPDLDGDVLRSGADDYLIKDSLDARMLVRAVRYAVERARAKAELRSSEARFRSVVQHASDLIAIVDARYVITYTSPSVERLFGYQSQELDGRSLLDLAHPDDAAYLGAFLHDASATPHRTLAIEWRIQHAHGSWRHVESVVANLLDDPNVGGIVVTTRDTHDRKTLQAQLAHQAFHDPLTSIANRALFVTQADHALARASRQGTPVAVLCLDIDDFKSVNDRLGHGAGDGLLTSVAARVQACVRAHDTVARLGGDEFAVLLDGSDVPSKAVVVAERILNALAQPFSVGREEVTVSASVGIAVSEQGRETSEELLRNADVAMYMAKDSGKAGYALFETRMHEALLARIALEGDLRRAVEREEFTLHFQPIVALGTLALTGFEALVRWRHPLRGVVPPLEFIPLAEQTGLIVPLGRWVLGRACQWIRRLQDAHGSSLMMTVNVSGRQLQDPGFPADVARALDAEGITPSSLVLEITETVMMDDTEATLARLGALKALGVRVAIDDFGTGYSSLNYLQQFPVDILKIDRAFVERLSHVDDGAVARAIIGLSKALHLSTIAEGIERPEQIDALVDLECEYGQGYFFERPVPEEQIDAVVRAGRSYATKMAAVRSLAPALSAVRAS